LTPVLYALTGFVIGVLIAYSGVGAGALLTPLLVFVGIPASTAIGSDLLFALVTKIVALYAHVRAKTIDRALLMRLAPAGVAGTLVGLVLTNWLHVHLGKTGVDHTLRVLLGCALIAAAVAVAVRPLLGKRREDVPVTYPRVSLAIVGFVVGLVVSLTSIGAGSLTLPLLLVAVPGVMLSRLVGTDIAFAVVLLVPSLLGHVAIGDVNVGLSALLLLGSIPGVFVGARIHVRLPDTSFRLGMAGILTLVGVFMLVRASS
jgi:hypothetical protein